ncbi:hypothetical protein [Sphingomonas sp. LR61]|uniref:hypothetical protein n=1 Tax=Sphingomonas sp. LR61 TaxID=3050234 RepID=UPI003FA79BDA
MDSMRVSVNLLGNCVAALVVARWQGALDRDRVDATLRPRRRSQTPRSSPSRRLRCSDAELTATRWMERRVAGVGSHA